MGITKIPRKWVKSFYRLVLSRLGLASRNDLAEAQSAIYQELKSNHTIMLGLRTALEQLHTENTQLRAACFIARREAQSMGAVLRNDLRSLNAMLEQIDPQPGRKLLRICIVLPYAYSLFNSSTSFLFGGSEFRAWILGRALAALGEIEVFFAVNDHGQGPLETWDKVKVYRATSLLAKLSPPPAAIWPEGRCIESLTINEDLVCEENLSYITNTDADLYCVFGVHNLAAEIMTLCHREERPVALFIGSDDHLAGAISNDSNSRDSYGNYTSYIYSTLKAADLIFAQTNHQAEMLRQGFGREAIVLPNPIDLNDSPLLGPRTKAPAPVCLWIGKSDQVKRPELLIDLARHLPDFQFLMVMNISNAEIHDRIQAEAPANVRIIERLSIPEIEVLFGQASFLVNTSRFEGFPNTFLQAGKFGVPIVSLNVDPDNFIQTKECGLVAGGQMESMVEGLRSLVADPFRYVRLSSNVYHYVTDHHEPTRIARMLNRVLLDYRHQIDPVETVEADSRLLKLVH